MLLYSALYLSGYGLELEDLKQFRQWQSRTPGHPEYGHTPGIETTTGPLGQGIANAVGFAMAEAHLAAVFNRDGNRIVDHYTYFICSDGDLMEGISHEASSFAGHYKFGKLIGFYDDNHITIDGPTELTYTDDAGERFEAYGWHVQHVADINDLDALDAAIEAAKAETGRPSMIVCRTHIGYGSPNKQDTAKAHGEALGEEEIKLTKRNLGWPSEESFYVPEEALAHWR
jgi:transketolase